MLGEQAYLRKDTILVVNDTIIYIFGVGNVAYRQLTTSDRAQIRYR